MSRIRTTKAGGFTLIELMVVVMIIGILASIAVPNFIGAQKKAQIAALKDNMHTVQVCAESYGTDSGGSYPNSPSGLGPYFPGGGNCIAGTAGFVPMNPLTGAQDPLYTETISDATSIESVRSAPPSASPGSKGRCGYGPAASNKSYAVTGTDEGGKRCAGPHSTTLVLSNL